MLPKRFFIMLLFVTWGVTRACGPELEVAAMNAGVVPPYGFQPRIAWEFERNGYKVGSPEFAAGVEKVEAQLKKASLGGSLLDHWHERLTERNPRYSGRHWGNPDYSEAQAEVMFVVKLAMRRGITQDGRGNTFSPAAMAHLIELSNRYLDSGTTDSKRNFDRFVANARILENHDYSAASFQP